MLNKENQLGAIVMSFSKLSNTLNHNLLCKITAYGFDENALTLIQKYFSRRHQIMIKKVISLVTRATSFYLGPLFFNTFH